VKASPKTIWRIPVYLPYLQLDLTDEAISAAERKIGHTLPQSFIALLREQNGGYIRYSLEDLPHEQIYGIGSSFPSLIDFDWEDDQEYVGFQLDGLVPFDGSFDEYLGLLKVDIEDRDFVLPSVDDIDATLTALTSEMGIQFEPPDSWAHGFPQHRARGLSEEPEWIWVSPNLVQRGFVRDDDARYEELRDRLPGEGSRYPGLPDSSFLLTVTEGLRADVVSACRAKSIDIRPLSEYTT